MSRRYIELYSLPSPMIASNSPVLVLDGALLMDRFSEKLFTCLTMQALDDRGIHALQVQLLLYDEVGAPLPGIFEYRYNSLKAKRDTVFGKEILIPVSNRNVRSFTVNITEVTFADYSIWTNSVSLQNVGKLQKLEEAIKDESIAKEFEIQYGSDCKYLPSDETIIWYCACGAINRADEERCHNCRRKLAALQNISYDKLKGEALNRNSSIEEKPGENNGDNGEEEKKKLRTRLFKAALILLPILLAVVLIITTVPAFIERQNSYRAAEQLLEQGKYDEAQAAFIALGDYQDARTQANNEVPYQKALAILESAKTSDVSALQLAGLNIRETGDDREEISMALYQAAKDILEEIDPYKDTSNMLKTIQTAFDEHQERLLTKAYEEAEGMLEKNAYLRAREAFLALGDYRDAADMAIECLYLRAVSALSFCETNNIRDIYLAISHSTAEKTRVSMPGTVLTELGSDVVYELKKCFTEDGVEFIYEEAPADNDYLPICEALANEFESLGSYKDSTDLMMKARETGDFTRKFYLLLKEGDLRGAVKWLNTYDDEIPEREEYLEWIEYLQTLCAEWELSMGDSTLIPFSAGVEYTKLELFTTAITIENNAATMHIIPDDGSYEVSLIAEFGEKQFSASPDGTVYYGYINQIDRFVYIRYTQNGALLSSCEYNKR